MFSNSCKFLQDAMTPTISNVPFDPDSTMHHQMLMFFVYMYLRRCDFQDMPFLRVPGRMKADPLFRVSPSFLAELSAWCRVHGAECLVPSAVW